MLTLCTPPEVEKGVEAGKKLPRKFLILAESFEANHTRDCSFFNNINTDFFWDEIQFSLFAKWNNSSSQTKISVNKVPLLFII